MEERHNTCQPTRSNRLRPQAGCRGRPLQQVRAPAATYGMAKNVRTRIWPNRATLLLIAARRCREQPIEHARPRFQPKHAPQSASPSTVQKWTHYKVRSPLVLIATPVPSEPPTCFLECGCADGYIQRVEKRHRFPGSHSVRRKPYAANAARIGSTLLVGRFTGRSKLTVVPTPGSLSMVS